MSISTYSDLQTQVTNWMANSGLSGQAADFITLAEAMLNRELPAVVTDIDLTGTDDERRIDISDYAVEEAQSLFLAESGLDEVMLLKKQDGTFAYSVQSDRPTVWAVDDNNNYIDLDCPLSAAYPFRLRAKQRFSLSVSAPTNWLLTNHPDVYLAATLVWSGMYKRNQDIPANMAAVLQQGVPAVRSALARQNKGTLTVDAALTLWGRYSLANWSSQG